MYLYEVVIEILTPELLTDIQFISKCSVREYLQCFFAKLKVHKTFRECLLLCFSFTVLNDTIFDYGLKLYCVASSRSAGGKRTS